MENANEFVTERELFDLLKKELEESKDDKEYHQKILEELNATLQKKMEDNKIITMHLDSEQCKVQIEHDKNSKEIELERIRNFTQKRLY
jgi:hypothetical protein